MAEYAASDSLAGMAGILHKSLAVFGLLLLGAWMNDAAEDLATGAKLVLARILIWGSIAAACLIWSYRQRLSSALLQLAIRTEQARRDSLSRSKQGGWAERMFIGLFLAACVSLTALAFFAPDLFVRFLAEDGPFETATAICYAFSALSCLMLALSARGHRSLQLSLALLAILFIVVGGEEISWGQRIFGFTAPESLAAMNVQGEFTLHNIYSISLFTYPALAVTAMLLFVAPLSYRVSSAARRIVDGLELPVAPPVCALLYGVMIFAYIAVGLRLGTPTPLPISYSDYAPHYDDEMLEFLIATLFTVFALSNWRLRTREPEGVIASSVMPAE